MDKAHLNRLIINFAVFIITFTVIYGISLYALNEWISNINVAMFLHLLNVAVMFILSLIITKYLSRLITKAK